MMRTIYLKYRMKRECKKLMRMKEPYDCGFELAGYINPRIAAQAAIVKEVGDRLAAVDPEFRKVWCENNATVN